MTDDSNKFRNKYKVTKPRAKWWNYSNNATYFITFCTFEHECLLGKIKNGEISFSEIGKIADEEWNKSFQIRKELFCEAYVIMPNHIHAILRIEQNFDISDNIEQSRGFIREPKSISSFIAGYKSTVTKRINKLRGTPKSQVWQSRFYDRILRNENEYKICLKYISENPLKWELDRYFM